MAARDEAMNVTAVARSLLLKKGPPSRYPDPESVIREIQRRARLGMALGYLAVGSSAPTAESRDHTLIQRGVRHFGTWDRALVAAGVDLATCPGRKKMRPHLKRRRGGS